MSFVHAASQRKKKGPGHRCVVRLIWTEIQGQFVDQVAIDAAAVLLPARPLVHFDENILPRVQSQKGRQQGVRHARDVQQRFKFFDVIQIGCFKTADRNVDALSQRLIAALRQKHVQVNGAAEQLDALLPKDCLIRALGTIVVTIVEALEAFQIRLEAAFHQRSA